MTYITSRVAKAAAAVLGFFLVCDSVHAATFQTFVDDESGFMAALGPATVVKTENFASAADLSPVAPAAGAPDVWNGFTAQVYGSGGPYYGGARYCQDLGGSNCIYWNSSAPRIPGLYGDFGPGLGISLKPASPTIAAISFDFIDWNDGGQRSDLTVIASDGSTTTVTGPTNPYNAPPKKFGVVLSAADIAAGRYITELRWMGLPNSSEVVGFYNVKTFTNPVLESSVKPVPSLSAWALALLSLLMLGLVGIKGWRKN